MRFLIFSILVLLSFIRYDAFGKENGSAKIESDKGYYLYEVVDINPEPIGGYQKIYEYIAKNLDISELTQMDTLKCEGWRDCRVIVEFIVTKQGKTKDHKIIQGLGSKYDSLSLEILRQMPISWKPGIKDEIPVDTKTAIPIRFSPTSTNDN